MLGSADGQERRDVDGDGWADVAKYARGVVRPRFFWDGGNGRTGFLTGGITYENREGGTMLKQILRLLFVALLATSLPLRSTLAARGSPLHH